MLHAKQEVQQLLNQLPDNISFEDIQYHIYVQQKIKQGLEEDEFDRRMTTFSFWL